MFRRLFVTEFIPYFLAGFLVALGLRWAVRKVIS